MKAIAVTPRTALLAGATGLVGGALLPMLLADEHYHQVHVLLRRAVPEIKANARLKLHRVDFARLPTAFPTVDDVYIALGTTAGATRLAVVSALGADPASRVFYNRVKGEMQAAVTQLGYTSVVIAQPSLLLGNRAALGQPSRPGEVWAARLLGPLGRLLPNGIRPIAASTVAAALLAATLEGNPGVRVLKSGVMQAHDPGRRA